MDFMATIGILVKRWYVVVPLVLLTLIASVGAYIRAPLQYETTASLVVLAPAAQLGTGSTAPANVNPFSLFGGSQETAAQVLQVRMSDTKVAERLQQAGVGGSWSFGIVGGSGPLIGVMVSEKSPALASASAERILEIASSEFEAMQSEAHAPRSQFIGLQILSSPSDPLPNSKGKVRAGAGLAAVGIALSLGATLALEGILRGRRREDDEEFDEALPLPPSNGVSRPENGHSPTEQPTTDWAERLALWGTDTG